MGGGEVKDMPASTRTALAQLGQLIKENCHQPRAVWVSNIDYDGPTQTYRVIMIDQRIDQVSRGESKTLLGALKMAVDAVEEAFDFAQRRLDHYELARLAGKGK